MLQKIKDFYAAHSLYVNIGGIILAVVLIYKFVKK
jgi:hypothetical protein